jgi:hypothetical protein
LLLTLGLLVALVGVIAFAITQMPTGSLSRPNTAAAQLPTAAPTSATVADGATDAATVQAIKDVIRRLDEAQMQAIASNDQNVMVETATTDFFNEEVAQNQDLVASGVTAIKLINLEWGAITVNGNSATATVWETWSTTLVDGTTEQGRDRNVYTLIKDDVRGWIVQGDDHPDQRPFTFGA